MRALIITEKLGTDDSRCSTFIANEGVRRGHEVFECYSDKISLLDGEVICSAERFLSETEANAAAQKFVIKRDFDVVFFRPNPPVDMAYLTTLYLLQLIENDVLILNKPSSVIRFPEKILPHYFAEFSPPTLISKNRVEILDFIRKHQGAVAKPLYWYGGNGVEKLSDNDIERLDALLATNKEPLVYQKFLPEVVEGDKRMIFVNGRYINTVNRVPPEGEFIANICHGGTPNSSEPNEYHRKNIIPIVEKFCIDYDIALCGIDVIGNNVTEMNITTPVIFPDLDLIYNLKEETNFWSELENRLSK